jgi:hypothetical protein
MSDKPPYAKTVPVYARHDQFVEVHWRMPGGNVIIVQVACPKETS